MFVARFDWRVCFEVLYSVAPCGCLFVVWMVGVCLILVCCVFSIGLFGCLYVVARCWYWGFGLDWLC